MRFASALVAMFSLVSLPANAASLCVLEVDGKTYLNGPCEFQRLGDMGSFTIGLAKDDSQPPPDTYFVYFYVDPAPHAFWNGVLGGLHAHDPLGELRRDGACWVNERAKVCAYE